MLDNKKIIIFDLDGTLIDSIDIWNQINIELVKRIIIHKDGFLLSFFIYFIHS